MAKQAFISKELRPEVIGEYFTLLNDEEQESDSCDSNLTS